MSDSNPYSAPKADLAVKPSGGGIEKIKHFKRFTAWGVFGLSLITYGIYTVYWLYSRTKILNELVPDNKIADWIPSTLILTTLVSIGAGIVSGGYVSAVSVGIANSIYLLSTLAYLVLYIILIFAFRNRMNVLSDSHAGSKFWIGGIMTFFFNAIYFQYKINQVHDEG